MPAAVAIPAIATAVAGGSAAAASIYGSRKASKASEAAARYQTQQANYAADLEAKAAAEALKFARETEDTRRREFQQTQERNYGLHLADLAREDRLIAERRARNDPFRNFSLGALGGLQKPLYAPGTRPQGGLIALANQR